MSERTIKGLQTANTIVGLAAGVSTTVIAVFNLVGLVANAVSERKAAKAAKKAELKSEETND